MKSTYHIPGSNYIACIPMIQNLYAPSQANFAGWEWGFKYTSGMYESFVHATQEQAIAQFDACVEAVEAYWDAATALTVGAGAVK